MSKRAGTTMSRRAGMTKSGGWAAAGAGFSLIEMLVAMVIMALSLGVLYQAAAGATRNVRVDERYTYAIQLAESLLADHSQLPPGGVDARGEASDFQWRVYSEPLINDQELAIELQRLDAVVSWGEPDEREVRLTTVAPVVPEQQ